MDRHLIDRISCKVAKQFPEMKSVRPTVQREERPPNGKTKYRLTYKGQAEIPGGRKIRRIVHVIADENGRVIRMSTSK